MAPSFDNLSEDEFDVEDINFDDLHEQFEVRLESGYDAFVVLDGLPIVPGELRPRSANVVE
jgi:translation initiation factor 3 subunit B